MKKIYVIRIENIDRDLITGRIWLAAKLLNYLLNGLAIGNETTKKRLESLLHLRKYCKVKQLCIFTLWNLGFRGCQIARMTGLCKSSIYYHINTAVRSEEMKDSFMILAEGITTAWI